MSSSIGISIVGQRRAGPSGWTSNIGDADFVLMVCTATYLRRVTGKEKPGEGLGVRWEGKSIYNRIYNDKPSGSRFIPILLPGSKVADIPTPVQGHNRYGIASFQRSDRGYDGLYRHLMNKPEVLAPPIGTIGEPVVWNVPYPRNPNFTGREAILKQLETALASGTPAALSQAIAGLGGVGKTQTAVEYAYRHSDQYRAVLWVRADTETSLVSGYRELAEALGLPEKDEGDSNKVNLGRSPLAGPRAGLPADPRQRRRPRPGQALPAPRPQRPGPAHLAAHNFDRLNIRRPIELPVLTPTEGAGVPSEAHGPRGAARSRRTGRGADPRH